MKNNDWIIWLCFCLCAFCFGGFVGCITADRPKTPAQAKALYNKLVQEEKIRHNKAMGVNESK